MDEKQIKRWTARRKSALVLEIIQGKTTVATASRQFDLTPAEIEGGVEDGKRGMENALRAKLEDVRGAVRATARGPAGSLRGSDAGDPCAKNWSPCWERTRADELGPAGPEE